MINFFNRDVYGLKLRSSFVVLLLVFLFPFSSLQAREGGEQCSHLLSSRILKMLATKPSLISRLFNSKHYKTYLGKGLHGKVYFVQSKKHPGVRFVEKSYYKRESLRRDSALYQVFDLSSQIYGPYSFNVLENLGTAKKDKLLLEYVEGVELHKLMADFRIPESLKIEMAEVYALKLKDFKFEVEQRLGLKNISISEGTYGSSKIYRDRYPDMLPYLLVHSQDKNNFVSSPAGRTLNNLVFTEDGFSALANFQIYIKSTNVVVSPYRNDKGEIEMTLIDPF